MKSLKKLLTVVKIFLNKISFRISSNENDVNANICYEILNMNNF